MNVIDRGAKPLPVLSLRTAPPTRLRSLGVDRDGQDFVVLVQELRELFHERRKTIAVGSAKRFPVEIDAVVALVFAESDDTGGMEISRSLAGQDRRGNLGIEVAQGLVPVGDGGEDAQAASVGVGDKIRVLVAAHPDAPVTARKVPVDVHFVDCVAIASPAKGVVVPESPRTDLIGRRGAGGNCLGQAQKPGKQG